ncbi:MAG: cytochrome c [Sphingomonadaceae bacterium]
MPLLTRLTMRLTAALALTAPLSLPSHAAQPLSTLPDTLAQRVAACTACHNNQSRSDAFFPRIAGKPSGYLYNQLVNFREGRRNYPMMTYMVDHLPDAYLREIADYFSALHPPYAPATISTASNAQLERGRTLVLQGDPAKKVPACIACHGKQLAGVEPSVPGLLGLPPDYINAQFGAWKSKIRRAQAPDCMAEIATRLSNADVAALSGWLGGQLPDAAARPATTVPLPLPLACGSVPDSVTRPASAP